MVSGNRYINKLMPLRTMASFYPLANNLSELLFKKMAFCSHPPLHEILKREPKLLWISTHGPTLGAIALIAAIRKIGPENGAKDRIMLIVAERTLYDNPLGKQLAIYLSQMRQPMSLEEITTCMKNSPANDLLIAPEGGNSLFGDGVAVQPFRSPKFVEIAVRNNMPMVLYAHRGAEIWGKRRLYKKRWCKFYNILFSQHLHKKFKENGWIFHITFPRRVPLFRIFLKLYFPELKAEALSEDEDLKMMQLWQEADKVKDQMQKMVESLN